MKTQGKHTPGPWYVEERNPAEYDITTGEDGDDVALVRTDHFLDNGKANARLIAAAPELLNQCYATLRQLEQVYIKGDPKTEGLCLSIRGLKGVISKAEGRA
jgi:hypothetical protein